MEEKVNLAAKLAAFDQHFSPKIVGELNDYKLEVVKARGEFVWHKHDDTDDFFLVLAGRLVIQLRGRDDIELGPGELFVVPAAIAKAKSEFLDRRKIAANPKSGLPTRK